ncbi:MAG: Transcriptional regulatory protein OmpR [Alphaproteobacteria bacterium MarineAlpha5_Bin9]|nr:MAG: Transcriptional regulatory protein OmpR [Alphaproteobacteria bacterium MarineAlpha5_Bin9]|tara:strand:- start:291 stop:965 length:675 start_codon:yes stop_codon:yes gene_type:complete
MSNSILIIDDDKRLRDLLENFLIDKKFRVFNCDDYKNGENLIKFFIFDLIIIDRMMPTGDGINLIKTIKKNSSTPIIMLTALGDSNNRIEGLQIGADDYISKPFEPEELYLRIKKLLKLYSKNADVNRLIFFGEYSYNLKTFQLKKNNINVYLTEGEGKLLSQLIVKKNDIVLREELAENNYEESEYRNIDVQITRLRQKIEKNPRRPVFIKTVRGKGYKLVTL